MSETPKLKLSAQRWAESDFRREIRRVVDDAAAKGLDNDRIVSALRDTLASEERILASQKDFARSYR